MAGLPLRLCYAVTIHKAQGMTVPEGVVIDWKSKNALGISGEFAVRCHDTGADSD